MAQKSSTSVETRAVSTEELRAFGIFPSGYRSGTELRLTSRGEEPELAWKLTAVPLARPVARRLDGDSVDAMAELYGPVENLRFIGALGKTGPAKTRLRGLLTWRYESWNETAWLCDIRIREGVRGQGIGSRLLQDLMWEAMTAGARGIMLETQTTNLDAIAFYLARGFHMVGFNQAMYGPPGRRGVDPALYFWLALDG